MTIVAKGLRRLARSAIAGKDSDRAGVSPQDAAAVLPAPLRNELIWQA